ANCHQMSVDKKPLVSTLKAPALEKLHATGGCLNEKRVAGGLWDGLDSEQRNAISAAIQKTPPSAKAPKDIVEQTLITFNCYACHVRNKTGGPEEAFNKYFQTTQPEMGEEGRIPPPLDGVGAKLKPEYLKQILDKGSHDRPYMLTRMPAFGTNN